jgi:hypothetical protein
MGSGMSLFTMSYPLSVSSVDSTHPGVWSVGTRTLHLCQFLVQTLSLGQLANGLVVPVPDDGRVDHQTPMRRHEDTAVYHNWYLHDSEDCDPAEKVVERPHLFRQRQYG